MSAHVWSDYVNDRTPTLTGIDGIDALLLSPTSTLSRARAKKEKIIAISDKSK